MSNNVADIIFYRRRKDDVLVIDAKVGNISRTETVGAKDSPSTKIYTILESLTGMGVEEMQYSLDPDRWKISGKKFLRDDEIAKIDGLFKKHASELTNKGKPLRFV